MGSFALASGVPAALEKAVKGARQDAAKDEKALRSAVRQPDARQPDVLFIVAEDLQACLSCYGNPICKTPNLDALAARGLRFDLAYCQYPLCNPTRSSLLTGLRPETTQVFGNELDWNERLKPGSTLPEYFRANGYETMRAGKIFHSGNQGRVFSDKSRWDRVVEEREGLPERKLRKVSPLRHLYESIPAEQRAKVYDQRAWAWGPVDVEDIDTADGAIAEQAVRILSQKRDKPLFLALGFHEPHLPLFAPKRHFDMYPPDKIPLPDYPENDLDDVPADARYGLANHKAFTPEKRREAIAAYYACVSNMDAAVGRALDALKRSGREDNTIVIFWGDHGFNLGEHLLWQKMCLFEESCRPPLIIAAPGVTKPGSVCHRVVEFIDTFPTLADLCGLKIPEGLEAISMVPLLKTPARPWKKGAFTSKGKGTSIRTERWRYTEWGGPDKAELYDHQSDPREIMNLAGDPKHKDTAAELSRLLHGGWKTCLPERT